MFYDERDAECTTLDEGIEILNQYCLKQIRKIDFISGHFYLP